MGYHPERKFLFTPEGWIEPIGNAMERFYGRWLPLHELDDDELLYHYTSLQGLKGILTARNIWCGHAAYFNDPSEIQYGQNIVRNALMEVMERSDDARIRAYLGDLQTQVSTLGLIHHPFIACFCASGNLLSQWREYASAGGGYSLGFAFSDSTMISAHADDLQTTGTKPYLRKVIYEKSTQETLVRDYIDELTSAVSSCLGSGISEAYRGDAYSAVAVMAVQSCNLLLEMLLSFKHPAFASEDEWRLIRATGANHDADKIIFDEAASGLKSYRPTFIYEREEGTYCFPLREIIHGPTLDSFQASSSLRLYCEHRATDNHPIMIQPHRITVKSPGYALAR